jgi:carbonic anhydrase
MATSDGEEMHGLLQGARAQGTAAPSRNDAGFDSPEASTPSQRRRNLGSKEGLVIFIAAVLMGCLAVVATSTLKGEAPDSAASSAFEPPLQTENLRGGADGGSGVQSLAETQVVAVGSGGQASSSSASSPSASLAISSSGASASGVAASLSWTYDSFHVGDWPNRGYHLCAGRPDIDYTHNEWQSPIDITSSAEKLSDGKDYDMVKDSLQLSVKNGGCSQVYLGSSGFTYQASYAGCPNHVAKWKGRNYVLNSFHFHAESENTVDGEHFPGEMQLVHQAADGSTLVISAFLKKTKAGPPSSGSLRPCNSFVNRMFVEGFEPAHNFSVGGGRRKRMLNPYREVIPEGAKFWSYQGSLTSPPCRSDVEWITLMDPVLVNVDDFRGFKRFLKDPKRSGQQDSYGRNKRPVQPLNSRPILQGVVAGGGEGDS